MTRPCAGFSLVCGLSDMHPFKGAQCLSPWIWAGLGDFCTERNVVEVMVCDVQGEA